MLFHVKQIRWAQCGLVSRETFSNWLRENGDFTGKPHPGWEAKPPRERASSGMRTWGQMWPSAQRLAVALLAGSTSPRFRKTARWTKSAVVHHRLRGISRLAPGRIRSRPKVSYRSAPAFIFRLSGDVSLVHVKHCLSSPGGLFHVK